MRRLDLVTAAVVLALAFAHELLIGRSGFFFDDFRNLAEARRLGFSEALLTKPMFEHFAPGHRLMDWLAAEPLGRDFRYASALETAWVLVLLGSFAGLLRTVWGAHAWQLVAIALLGLSWTPVASNQWFAAGAHVAPCLALMVFSLFLAARWGVTGRGWLAAGSVLAALIGALFWVQAVMTPLVVATVLTLLVDRAHTPGAFLLSLRRRGPYLAGHTIVMSAFLGFLVTRPWRPDLGTPTIDDVVTLGRVVVVRGLLPPLLGKGLGNGPLTDAESAWQVIAAALALAVLVFAIATRRRWVAGLVVIASAYGATVVMIAAGRLARNGPMIGNEPRYVAVLVPLAILGFATMLQPTARTPALPAHRAVRSVLVAVSVIAIAVVSANVYRSADASFWRTNGVAGKAAAAQLGPQLNYLSAREATRLVNGDLAPPVFYAPHRGHDSTLGYLAAYFNPDIHPLGDSSVGRLLQVQGTVVAAVRFRSIASVTRACRRRCVIELPAKRPVPAAYVQVRAGRRALRAVDIAPVGGSTIKDTPIESLRSGAPRTVLTGPVWANNVHGAQVTVTVDTPVTVRAGLGTLAAL